MGKRKPHAIGGVKFVLSACRTAMNWARKHRHLPPYSENPFSSFPIESLRDRSEAKQPDVPTKEQAEAFFRACDGWQRPIFLTLAMYGLRVGELTHLLVEDVSLSDEVIIIRSKPELL